MCYTKCVSDATQTITPLQTMRLLCEALTGIMGSSIVFSARTITFVLLQPSTSPYSRRNVLWPNKIGRERFSWPLRHRAPACPSYTRSGRYRRRRMYSLVFLLGHMFYTKSGENVILIITALQGVRLHRATHTSGVHSTMLSARTTIFLLLEHWTCAYRQCMLWPSLQKAGKKGWQNFSIPYYTWKSFRLRCHWPMKRPLRVRSEKMKQKKSCENGWAMYS